MAAVEFKITDNMRRSLRQIEAAGWTNHLYTKPTELSTEVKEAFRTMSVGQYDNHIDLPEEGVMAALRRDRGNDQTPGQD